MKKIEVFDGNMLHSQPVQYQYETPKLSLFGTDHEGNRFSIPFDDNLLSRHILLLGGIGTGKTNTFYQVLHQLRRNVTSDDVVVIFDTKGDFYKKYNRPGDIVISNDDTATGPAGKDYWNIFNELENGERLEETIVEISKTLFGNRIEKTNQPFFPNAAKDLFSAILTDSVRNKERSEISNKTLRDFFLESSPADIRAILNANADLRSMISYISDDRSPQTQGVLSELQQQVRELFVGNFKKAGTLSMRNIIRNKGGKFVFIEYDIGIGKMLAPIYSLLFDLAIKEALCRKEGEGNVFFVVDEFSLLPNLQHIDDAVNFGRSLGI